MIKILGGFLQKLIDVIGGILQAVVNVLPDSPFMYITSADSEVAILISKINYFIPISEFVVIIQAWLVGVTAYYLYSVIARWTKLIE